MSGDAPLTRWMLWSGSTQAGQIWRGVACPKCGAPPLTSCIGARGRRASMYHQARVIRTRRLMSETITYLWGTR